MKFPSMFKLSNHQRFRIEPRYYDPVKEEIEARTARIAADMKYENGETGEIGNLTREDMSRIAGAFTRRASRRSGMNIMQLVILLLLVGLVVGFWYFGNIAVYIILTLSCLLLYLKIKRII
jgi:hypothetical protein